jgi:hypothetical protein
VVTLKVEAGSIADDEIFAEVLINKSTATLRRKIASYNRGSDVQSFGATTSRLQRQPLRMAILSHSNRKSE